MIGLDTNVIVRYLVQDDAAQCAIVNRLFEQELTDDTPGYLSLIALIEVVWVLQAGYESEREDVAAIIEKLLRSRAIVVESAETVCQALREFRAGRAEFADCLIERAGKTAGCSEIVTFDKVAVRDAGMKLLVASRPQRRQPQFHRGGPD